MFSPIGKKRIILKNYQQAKQTGRPVEDVARESFSKSFSSDGAGSPLSRSYSSFGFGSMSSIASLSDEEGATEERRIRKKRSKHKKYLTQTILEDSMEKEDTPLGRAVQKLTHRAAHFRRDRDGVLLGGFESRSLDRAEFRLMLRKVFSLEFSDSEYDESFKLFDTDDMGAVDGCEFLVYFTHLGTLYKDKRKSTQLKKQRDHEVREKRKLAEKEQKLQQKRDKSVDFEYSSDDVAFADSKFRSAAKLYDRSSTSAKSVRAFESNYLSPVQFKALCLQTFDLKLTPKEVGALVDQYDTAHNKIVDSSFFLVQFLRTGVKERHLDRSRQIFLTRQNSSKLLEDHAKKTEEMEARLEAGLDGIEFSDEDLDNGLLKLRRAAKLFDKSHPSSLSLDGFCSVFSTPGIFKEMLRRTFNLVLPQREAVAVISYFDSEGNGTVNNSDFLTFFRRSSTIGRFTEHSIRLERKRKAEEDANAEQERLLREQWGKLEDKVKYEFNDDDRNSGLDKLTKLAKKYYADRSTDTILKAFKVGHMGPAMWRDMMKRTFFVQFTDGELAYFISLFKNDNMNIDCKKFLVHFNTMVFEERTKMRSHQLNLDRERALEVKRKEKALADRKKQENDDSIDFNFSDHDMESCLSKFRRAALNHDKSHSGSVSLSAFEVAGMPAIDFKELCRRVFRIELSAKELGAIVSLCGKASLGISPIKKLTRLAPEDDPDEISCRSFVESDRPGTTQSGRNESAECNCNEFMILFSYLQRMGKHSVFSQRCSLYQNLKKVRAAEHETIMERQLASNVKLTIFIEADSIKMMQKVNEACQKFTVDSAAYLHELAHFKGPCITPASFRDIFFKIFLVRLSFPEVGALCHQLNPELNKEFLINGNNFLTSFYKLSRIHEKILLGMNVSEDINDPSILKISSDFKILPAERPSTSGSSKLTRNSSSATRRHDIEKGDGSGKTLNNHPMVSTLEHEYSASNAAIVAFSPLSRNRPSTTSSSNKLPTLKQLESKLEAVDKKSEELSNLFLKKHVDRNGFTKEYAVVIREREEAKARIKFGEYQKQCT